MDVREKLIDLLTGYSIDTQPDVEYVADHLISNGVTVQECAYLQYIERESAIESLTVALDSAINALRNASSADTAPVVHGRWIEQEKYTFGTMYDCSICGDRILDNGHAWNYCPNCGAIMDGGSENG